jgi:hypothetical protein
LPKLDKKLGKEQIASRCTDIMMVVNWKDKWELWGKVDRATNKPVTKRECVMDYNRYMGVVDKTDSSLECVRKSCKWYGKLFFHLLDITTSGRPCVPNVAWPFMYIPAFKITMYY